MKKDRTQAKLLEELERTPIIQAACERAGISRNTYYRWMNEDSMFRMQVDERLRMGIDLVNDVAESNVLNGIKKGDSGFTKYWLSARHTGYRRPFPRILHSDDLDPLLQEAKAQQAEKEIDRWLKGWESLGIPNGARKYSPQEQKAMKGVRDLLAHKKPEKDKRDSNPG